MTRSFLLVLAVAITLAPSITRAQPAKPWPREVQAIYDGLKQECREMGGKFVPERGRFATQTEVTNDGQADWVLEYDAAACSIGRSMYCGTAGCHIDILASTRSGLREVFANNVRGWEAVQLDAKRMALVISVHGSACGSVGAEACAQTLVWNARASKWDLVASKRGIDADEMAAMEAEAAAYVPPPIHSARWFFVAKDDVAIAGVSEHREIGVLGLRCQPGGGLMMSVVPQAALRLPPTGQPLILAFKGSDEFSEANQVLYGREGLPDHDGMLSDGLQALLAGRDEGLEILASVDGGEEWQQLDYFSLAGSSAAIRSLEAACAKQPRGAVAANGNAKQVDFPPIPEGYYVSGMSCAEAIADIDVPMLTRFHRKGIGSWDGMSRIDRIEELGNARYLVHAWSWGNGDDPVGSGYKFVVRVTGPSSYLEETYGETFTLCPNVPKAIRDAF